ncbi:MAG TPA: hypothetical protein VEY33_09980 [Gemmatimonadota bacterium]|nr:hypothetical protein [Gemmatimonadota bacterium]
MKSSLRLLIVSMIFLAAWSAQASAQEDQGSSISLYRVAPGQHIAFLQWMANQEAASQDAGVQASQWYVHLNGDSWDFLQISLDLSDEQGEAVEAAARARGLKTGAPAGIEFRQYIAWHTDTDVAGPMTAAELLAGAQGN